MKSFTTLKSLATNLSSNTSTANSILMAELINNEHRYLLQKYFSNETTYSIATAGGTTGTLTGSLAIGAVSATLNTAWTGNTTKVQVTFSSGDIRMVNVIQGLTSLTWDMGLSAAATTAITIGGQQYYPLPPNYSKLKSLTISIGSLTWTLKEVFTTQEWNQLNVFPYYADIPANFFIYPGGDHGGQIGIWPIPSTTNNRITYSYKFRVPDLSIEDYTTPGTVSIATKSTALTGVATTFTPTTNIQNESRWVKFDQPTGDNLWYQIVTIPSATSAVLYQPYQGIAIAGVSAYTIGQMPLLMEDFHDMLVWKPLQIYYSSGIGNDPKKAAEYQGLYNERLELMKDYTSTNTVNVNLRGNTNYRNPNAYPQTIGGSS